MEHRIVLEFSNGSTQDSPVIEMEEEDEERFFEDFDAKLYSVW
jgi:hypothetical protein